MVYGVKNGIPKRMSVSEHFNKIRRTYNDEHIDYMLTTQNSAWLERELIKQHPLELSTPIPAGESDCPIVIFVSGENTYYVTPKVDDHLDLSSGFIITSPTQTVSGVWTQLRGEWQDVAHPLLTANFEITGVYETSRTKMGISRKDNYIVMRRCLEKLTVFAVLVRKGRVFPTEVMSTMGIYLSPDNILANQVRRTVGMIGKNNTAHATVSYCADNPGVSYMETFNKDFDFVAKGYIPAGCEKLEGSDCAKILNDMTDVELALFERNIQAGYLAVSSYSGMLPCRTGVFKDYMHRYIVMRRKINNGPYVFFLLTGSNQTKERK